MFGLGKKQNKPPVVRGRASLARSTPAVETERKLQPGSVRNAQVYITDANLQDRILVDNEGGLYASEGTNPIFLQPLREMLATYTESTETTGKAGHGEAENRKLEPAEVVFLAPHDFRQKVRSIDQPRKKSGTETVQAARRANQVVNHVLGRAIDAKASDFYLDIRNTDKRAILSIRTYGIVREIDRMGAEEGREIAIGLFARAGNDQWESSTPTDTAFSHMHGGRLYRVRANSLPEVRGAALSCRIRDPQFVLPLDQAGYSPAQQAYITRMCRSPGGLILISGETNSGKSTTLASLMKDAPRGQRMIEIGDPVEVWFDNVTHCEIDHRRDDSEAFFEKLLSSTVRQNPDALVLAEIRDPLTAGAAERMAIQGKRVFSTLHTQNCVAAIPRLANLGIDEHLLPLKEFIAGIVNQNLVPVVCPRCCRREPSSPILVDRYRLLFGDNARYVNPEGCGSENPACVGGVIGQTLVAEVFPLGLDDGHAHELIGSKRLWELQDYMQKKFNIQTKEEHARDKVLAGQIDPELTEAIIGEWTAGLREVTSTSQSGTFS